LQPIPNSIIFHWRVNMLHKTNTSRIGSDSYMGFSPVRFKRTSHCIHAFQVLVSQGGSLLNHTPNSTKKWQLVPPESLAHVTQQIDLSRKHRPRYNLTHVLPRLKFNHGLMASHWIQCQLLLARVKREKDIYQDWSSEQRTEPHSNWPAILHLVVNTCSGRSLSGQRACGAHERWIQASSTVIN
jgi:hypothetical protein